jgi:hypothetical protein
MTKYKSIKITPKEKADQLLESVMFSRSKQLDLNTGEYQPIPTNPHYKECALIVVNEILEFMKKDDLESETCYWANHPLCNFWIKVEREIKSR